MIREKYKEYQKADPKPKKGLKRGGAGIKSHVVSQRATDKYVLQMGTKNQERAISALLPPA